MEFDQAGYFGQGYYLVEKKKCAGGQFSLSALRQEADEKKNWRGVGVGVVQLKDEGEG